MGKTFQNGIVRFFREDPESVDDRILFETRAQLETDITIERIQFTLWFPPENHKRAAKLLEENVEHHFIPDDEGDDEEE